MDYTKFLGKKEEAVLAYLGGPNAYGRDRRLRVDPPRPPYGFHRFEIKGRTARPIERVDPTDEVFAGLTRARGHHVAGWLVSTSLERIHLLPAEEPAPMAILRARRWYSGDLVFEALDFDGEVEEEARLRLERLLPLGDRKGVPSSLRVAHAIALTLAVAARMQVPLSMREARAAVGDGDIDADRATRFVTIVAERRAEEAARARVRAIVAGQRPAAPVVAVPIRERPTLDNAALRAEVALDGAHARMLSSRRLGDGNLEVSFEFMGERFISVVDAITLHVYDSGVCLAGADELVTLDSLPAVIREAIETDQLVITRR